MVEKNRSTTYLVNNKKIYLDGRLKTKLDLMLEYKKKNFDVPFLIDGAEGSGKSTLAMTCAWYLSNGEFSAENIIEGEEDIIEKLDKAKKGSVLMIDEGFLMFSSRDSMSKRQKALVQILSVIRQKNIILIIVCPSFFEMNKYVAVHRTKCLIHVYTKGFERGRFLYFDQQKKRLLYELGKVKNGSYNVVQGSFFGRFTDFKPDFLDEYMKTKEKSLMEALRKGYESSKRGKEDDIRIKAVLKMLESNPKMSKDEIGSYFGVTGRTIRAWVKEAKDKEMELGVSP